MDHATIALGMVRKRAPRPRFNLFYPAGGEQRQPRGEQNPVLQTIWHMVSAIPRGKVSTYGAVAQAAGLPGRARQVGYALRIAPKGLNLPWHRVLGSGGKIVFPPDPREYNEQARRLHAEGVKVKDGRVPAAAVCTPVDR